MADRITSLVTFHDSMIALSANGRLFVRQANPRNFQGSGNPTHTWTEIEGPDLTPKQPAKPAEAA